MNPQKRYYQWKQEQGLPINGSDVTDGDTVQHQPNPTESAIKCAVLIYMRLHKAKT